MKLTNYSRPLIDKIIFGEIGRLFASYFRYKSFVMMQFSLKVILQKNFISYLGYAFVHFQST